MKLRNDKSKFKEHTHQYNKRRNNIIHMYNSTSVKNSRVYNIDNGNNSSCNKIECVVNERARYERAATTFTHSLRLASPSSRTSTLLP